MQKNTVAYRLHSGGFMLVLRNITYEVDDNNENKEILKNVSVTIDDHFVAITGPNGGGKSTLAKMIAGIIRPTSGQILLDGEDITGLNITERARKGISFAFQQPVHFKGLTVKDLITIAAGKEMSVSKNHKSWNPLNKRIPRLFLLLCYYFATNSNYSFLSFSVGCH